MGLPMARALRRAQIDTTGLDIRAEDHFENLKMHFDPATFVADRSVILTMLRDEAQTEAMLFGSNGLAPALTSAQTLILCSTLTPDYTRALPARLPEGLRVIDAPVIGDPIAAEAARLMFLVGAEAEVVDELSLFLAAMGENIVCAGAFGAGMEMAILNTFVAASSVAAVRSAMDAARAKGLDVRQLLDVLQCGDGQTWFGENFDTLTFARAGITPENYLGFLERELSKAGPMMQDPHSEGMAASAMEVLRRLETTDIPLGLRKDW